LSLAVEATVEKVVVVGAPILSVAIVLLKLEKHVMMATKSTKAVVPTTLRTHTAEMESARTANNVTMQTPATMTPLSIRMHDAVMVLFNQERTVMMETMTTKIVEATGNHADTSKTIVWAPFQWQ
jgi:hypothetical protein